MEYGISLKFNLRELPCYLLVLSLFFPTRGTILGITYYHVLMLALIVYGLTIKWRLRRCLPTFVMVYGLILVITDIIGFQATKWWYYISNLAPYILAFLFIPTRMRVEKSLNKFIYFIIFVFTLYSVFCIIESLTYYNIFDILTNTKIEKYILTNEIRFGFVRNRGAADISINNGMLLCLVLSLVSYVREIRKNRIIDISYILIFGASFLSLSRGVWIQLAISQLMIFISLSQKNRIRTMVRVLVMSFAVLFAGMVISSDFVGNIFDMFKNMLLSIVDVFTHNESANMIGIGHRFLLYGWVYETVKDNLFFGLGVGTPVSVLTTLGYNKISIEVMWLYIVYQSGLFGLFGFIYFQIGSFKYLIKNLKNSQLNKRYNINYYVLSATLGYFIALFSCSGFEDLRFYYILIALCLSGNLIKGKLKNEK